MLSLSSTVYVYDNPWMRVKKQAIPKSIWISLEVCCPSKSLAITFFIIHSQTGVSLSYIHTVVFSMCFEMAEIVICFSPDNVSVRVERGFNTVTTVSRTENSESDGIRYQFFQSSAKTALMACCCLTIRLTMSYVDRFHLVATDAISLCWGSFHNSCFSWRSWFFNQLWWKSSTRECNVARACFTWSSLTLLLIARLRLWPKQLTCNPPRLLHVKPAIRLEPFSVVVAMSWSGFRSQWTKASVTDCKWFRLTRFLYREKLQDRMTAGSTHYRQMNSKRHQGNHNRAGPKISSCWEVFSLYELRLHNTIPCMVIELGKLVLWEVLPWREFIARILFQ